MLPPTEHGRAEDLYFSIFRRVWTWLAVSGPHDDFGRELFVAAFQDAGLSLSREEYTPVGQEFIETLFMSAKEEIVRLKSFRGLMRTSLRMIQSGELPLSPNDADYVLSYFRRVKGYLAAFDLPDEAPGPHAMLSRRRDTFSEEA